MINLETFRLQIRPFESSDLAAIHRILDQSFGDGSKVEDSEALAERSSWLHWSRLSQEWLPKLHQPPYGDLALTLKEGHRLIGSVGLVPCLMPFDQIPGLRMGRAAAPYARPEVGLYWVIDGAFRNQGFASEGAQAVIDFAFSELNLGRIIATTEYGNLASQGVMRKLGMTLHRNPLPTPHYMQVVGLLERS